MLPKSTQDNTSNAFSSTINFKSSVFRMLVRNLSPYCVQDITIARYRSQSRHTRQFKYCAKVKSSVLIREGWIIQISEFFVTLTTPTAFKVLFKNVSQHSKTQKLTRFGPGVTGVGTFFECVTGVGTSLRARQVCYSVVGILLGYGTWYVSFLSAG